MVGVTMNIKKKFTEKFKPEAIKLVTEKGYSPIGSWKNLGINSKNISR